MWRLVYLALTEALEILPGTLTLGVVPSQHTGEYQEREAIGNHSQAEQLHVEAAQQQKRVASGERN